MTGPAGSQLPYPLILYRHLHSLQVGKRVGKPHSHFPVVGRERRDLLFKGLLFHGGEQKRKSKDVLGAACPWVADTLYLVDPQSQFRLWSLCRIKICRCCPISVHSQLRKYIFIILLVFYWTW